MKIYLYLTDKIVTFSLPKEVNGSYSFDENSKEKNKLINVEARDNQWVIYSTGNSFVIYDNNMVGYINLKSDTFYIIKRNNVNYLIYVTSLNFNSIEMYSYDQNVHLNIGNTTSANIQYPCPLLNDLNVKINVIDNKIILEKNSKVGGVYVNKNSLTKEKCELVIGDSINIYGLKIMFLNNVLLMNNPGGKLIVLPNTNINKCNLVEEPEKNIEIEDKELYLQKDYFSKSPRVRRLIVPKQIKIIPPPSQEKQQELPLILTMGPMLTMAVSSCVMVANTLNKISTKEITLEDSWPTLLTSCTMLVSMLLWPSLTRMYNARIKKRREKILIKKYKNYLKLKEEELLNEYNLQKSILIETLIPLEECINIISTKNMNFWSKRVDQNDFLTVRIGVGDEPLAVEFEYPEDDGFNLDDNNLKKQADEMVEKYKYIKSVPISYSFNENIVTAIMGVNKQKVISFVNNILLQLLTFYSYEDLKIVVLTNEMNKTNWEYIKYLNHNFNNDKNFRYFASTTDGLKNVAEVLNGEVNKRKEAYLEDNSTKKVHIPHYIILIDDYERVKRCDFIKVITEIENNIGFSIIIMEDRLSRLPSRCNNFITVGVEQSGILKNSYEKQEQIIFKDEIFYGVNMMNVSKILSNVPVEFEDGIKSLPDAISFMEMENVGKVEQLNVLNRWKTNDSTVSIKAEIGVDNQGSLMYLDLHEKYHGPHGLIAGTTGSGKSEFIITYILSMCINYSPDDVAFILIDYKGGGLALAFENKTTGISLPHLAGTITNLDRAEMDRTLVSIDSEVKRRQHMFNEARELVGESTIDIYKYQRHYHEGRLKEPIPHLFIVCDEFAELKSQQPEFMDNLISVARIGRSLGVHLILATQKPSGVVNDQIWSNTKFRVCLKVQDESDSKEMLKRPEAASIKQAGRYYLQVGYDELFELGQSGWCGAKYYPSDSIVKDVDKSINVINDFGAFIRTTKENSDKKIEAQGEQLAAIMKNIMETANKINKKAKRLWLDNIPSIILIDDTEKKYNHQIIKNNVEAVIGEYDAPEKQLQGIVKYNYLNDGNVLCYSSDSNETENFLSTLIYSTTKNHTSDEINYYIIDFGAETIKKYENLPHIGGIVNSEEPEKYNNLIKLLKDEMKRRKKKFSNFGGEYVSYIKNNPGSMPIITVIINNFTSYNETVPNVYEVIPELVRDSVRYGIVYIFTGNATNSIPNRISQYFQTIYAYKLKDKSDYQYLFNVKGKTLPRDIEGRGILNIEGLHEFQTASIVKNPDELNDHILGYVNQQQSIQQPKALSIPHIPPFIRLEHIKDYIKDLKNLPIGIEKWSLNVSKFDLTLNTGTLICSGKLVDTLNFSKSILYILKFIPNINLMIFDLAKQLELSNTDFQNYYTENPDEIILKITSYIDNLISKKATIEGIIYIYNLSKFLQNIEDISLFNQLTEKIKKYEKISIIGVDDAKKLKDLTYEAWYKNIFGSGNGIWIGKGITEQSIIKTSSYSKELQISYNSDMGFVVIEGEPTLIKLVDFFGKMKEDEDGE